MIHYQSDGVINFSLWDKFPEIFCIFSTRKLGNMNTGKISTINSTYLLNKYKINIKELINMQQVHSNTISLVTLTNKGTIIPNVDGLISKQPDLFLGVRTADCVPLFFYDCRKRIIGVAHAGWKGTLNHIAEKMINTFVNFGSKTQDIYVVIGPHIGSCCYDIPKSRADAFTYEYKDLHIIKTYKNKYYLDLGLVNNNSLLKKGIMLKHIQLISECTSCKNDLYFSYRKETHDSYGEMLGIIGIRNKNN